MSFRTLDVDSITEPVLTEQDIFPIRNETAEQVQAAVSQLIPQARSAIQTYVYLKEAIFLLIKIEEMPYKV